MTTKNFGKITFKASHGDAAEGRQSDFFNFHIYNRDSAIWTKTILTFSQANFITRAYIANSRDNWRDCIRAGVTAIATDKVSNHSWAMVSNTGPYITRES